MRTSARNPRAWAATTAALTAAVSTAAVLTGPGAAVAVPSSPAPHRDGNVSPRPAARGYQPPRYLPDQPLSAEPESIPDDAPRPRAAAAAPRRSSIDRYVDYWGRLGWRPVDSFALALERIREHDEGLIVSPRRVDGRVRQPVFYASTYATGFVIRQTHGPRVIGPGWWYLGTDHPRFRPTDSRSMSRSDIALLNQGRVAWTADTHRLVRR